MAARRSLVFALTLITVLAMLTIPTPAGAQTPSTCFGRTVTRAGGSGGDFIQGTEGSDVIHGGGGGDVIVGGGGNDYICNSPEDDFLYGEAGADVLYGSGGRDTVIGQAGNDRLSGEDGEDSLYDGTGSDIIDGGAPVLDSATSGDFGYQCADGVSDTRISVYWSAPSSSYCNGPAFPV